MAEYDTNDIKRKTQKKITNKMKQLLIAHLNKLVDELAKKHYVSKEQIRISYEFYQFYYYVDKGTETYKRELDI